MRDNLIFDESELAAAAAAYKKAFKSLETTYRTTDEFLMAAAFREFLARCDTAMNRHLVCFARTHICVFAFSDADPYGKMLPTYSNKLLFTGRGFMTETVIFDYDERTRAQYHMSRENPFGLDGERKSDFRSMSTEEAIGFLVLENIGHLPADISGVQELIERRSIAFRSDMQQIVDMRPQQDE